MPNGLVCELNGHLRPQKKQSSVSYWASNQHFIQKGSLQCWTLWSNNRRLHKELNTSHWLGYFRCAVVRHMIPYRMYWIRILADWKRLNLLKNWTLFSALASCQKCYLQSMFVYLCACHVHKRHTLMQWQGAKCEGIGSWKCAAGFTAWLSRRSTLIFQGLNAEWSHLRKGHLNGHLVLQRTYSRACSYWVSNQHFIQNIQEWSLKFETLWSNNRTLYRAKYLPEIGGITDVHWLDIWYTIE